jgi:hypothetical protein
MEKNNKCRHTSTVFVTREFRKILSGYQVSSRKRIRCWVFQGELVKLYKIWYMKTRFIPHRKLSYKPGSIGKFSPELIFAAARGPL